MTPPTFNDAITALLALAVTAAIVYASIFQNRPDAWALLGPAFGLLIGWFARGRVTPPTP